MRRARTGYAVLVVSALLLLSWGAAVFASPVTLTAMYRTTRRQPSVGVRVAAGVIGALTAAEAVWAITYVVAGEGRPWIWLVPAAGGLVAGLVLARPWARRRGWAPVD